MPNETELSDLKGKLKETWGKGDYGVIAKGLAASAEDFLKETGVKPGDRVLDVACGSGQLAIPAARAGAAVTGVDIVEDLVRQAEENTVAEGLDARFDQGDVEDLPYPEESYDLVVSLIGAMFAPRPERAAGEMLRVCRPGGRVVMGNWTPEGFVGDFFKLVSKFSPPPDMPSPLLWGQEDVAKERLGGPAESIEVTRSHLHFDYPMEPEAVARHYLKYFGPTRKAAEMVEAGQRAELEAELAALWEAANQASDGTTQVDAEILRVTAHKKAA